MSKKDPYFLNNAFIKELYFHNLAGGRKIVFNNTCNAFMR